MPLDEYRSRRDFERTSEPEGEPEPEGAEGGDPGSGPGFVVQKHAATRLHYDFRLEAEGVLKSWAVPKGPSLDPADKRLAVQVEDHPLDYGSFEGVIPEGQYGGGAVLLWDRGVWEPRGDPLEGLREGKLSFGLRGEKLSGSWKLVRMRGEAGEGGRNWLLIKEDDGAARPGEGEALVEGRPESVRTGRLLDEIAEDRDRVWDSREGEVEQGTEPAEGERAAGEDASGRDGAGEAAPPTREELLRLPGAREAPLPERPSPQLATRVDAPPAGPDWLHEIKFDGYRLLARAEEGRVRLLTRNGKDWTPRFSEVRDAVAERVGETDALLDGEAVVLRPDGTTSFQALQESLGDGPDHPRVFYVFDLLHWDGVDLGAVPLHHRKEALAALTGGATSGTLRYSDHVEGQGPDFLQNACRLALEGVISKRRDAPYREGRGRDWLKAKCVERQEFVVVGWTEPSGARHGFGALLVAVHDGEGRLTAAGKVGTGFTDRDLTRLSERLRELEVEKPPIADPPGGSAARGLHWVRPELVVEVEFTEWTRDGSLRHPSFQGVREDREPEEVVMEEAAPEEDVVDTEATETARTAERDAGGSESEVLGVRLSSPDRILWPGQGVTKLQLARYYEEVAEWMLPHVRDRPLSLVRCPKGTSEPCFFQKHPDEALPDVVGRVTIPEKEDEEGVYVYVDRPEALIALVQVGTLEIHTWGSREDRVERPDRMVVDLDPGPGVPWPRIVEAAHEVRDRLLELGLTSFPKTTGGKGLHVEVPLVRRHEWDDVKEFARGLAEAMASERSDRYTATSSKAKRKGKIYVDYLRNGRGATYIAPYSTRAREGAPVAVPLRWDEVVTGLRPDRYRTDTLSRRLRALPEDPWAEEEGLRQSITRDAREALGV